MSQRKDIEQWIEDNRERADQMSYAAIAREVGGDHRTARKHISRILDRKDSYHVDYATQSYMFSIDRYRFDASFAEVENWVRWYVYDGCAMSQRTVTRMAWCHDGRRLTRDFARRIFAVLGIDKNSPPFPPHLLHAHTPEELAKLHFAQAQADAEHAIRADEARQWRGMYRSEVQRKTRLDVMGEEIAQTAGIATWHIDVPPAPSVEAEPYSPVIVLSDWHVGARTSHYGRQVYWQRVESLCAQLDDWFRCYRRPVDEAHIAICGDMIDGPGGNMRAGQQAEQDLYYDEQVSEAAKGILRVMGHLRGLLPDTPIIAHTVTGNHGRGTSGKGDDPMRLPEALLYRLCEAMTERLGVQWDRGPDVLHVWRVYSTQVIQTHGDRAPKGLQRICHAMRDRDADWQLVLRGHRHSLEVMELHDALGVQAGTMMGDTHYGLHQLGLSARPSQSIIEVRPSGPRVPGTLLL
jgi:hypothetical protein